MTGPGQLPLSGWYPDPDGVPGLVRWWNGRAWSDVATPAGPGVTVRSAPELASQPTAGVAPPLLEPVPARPHDRAPWLIGLSVLALVVLVVAGLVVSRSGGGQHAATDRVVPSAPGPQVPPGVVPPAGPSAFPPGTVRIVDAAAGISYPYLGAGWYEWATGIQAEMTQIAGQFFTTQDLTPDGGRFIAQCTSGPLAAGYGYAGPSTLARTVATLADSVRQRYYPAPNERRILRDEDRTVDGHAAHLTEFQLSWDVPGYDATGERAALLLIDVGRPAPALLYLSIPNTHAELYGVIDRVIGDIGVQ